MTPGTPQPRFIHFLYIQYLGLSVCTVPTYCVGGEGGGAEIWLTGSGSEDLLRDVTLQEVGGGGVLTVNGKLCPMGYHIYPILPTTPHPK